MRTLKRKILIVEDDASIRFLLRQNLEFEGYEICEAADGAEGMRAAEAERPDLLLLDLMLPGMSGLEICKRLRQTGNEVPIIMLTARDQNMDKVMGLKNGADDYVTKPFDVMVLIARIEALLRRTNRSVEMLDQCVIGAVKVDFVKGTVTREGQLLEMTKLESDLLRLLVQQAGRVVTRQEILETVWGHDQLLSTRTIDTHITHLRKKIEPVPGKPQHIITVHRVGYRFEL